MRRIILACVFAGIFAMPAQAQSLRDQLVGAWSLVSCDPQFQIFTPICGGPNPNGILIYDASGRYAWIMAARGRPKASAGRNSPTEEIGALGRGVWTQFGTWSVNEDKTITGRVDGAFFPNVEGTTDSNTVIISVFGDELRVGDRRVPGAYNVWRRIKR